MCCRTVAVMCVVCLVVTSPPSHAVQIAAHGEALAAIVVAPDATVAEEHAATEIARYLGRIAGCEFAVGDAADGPAIYVGPTDRAREAGIDAHALGGEEWIVRTAGEDLLVVGGRPRGTLYAAYRLLEDVLGVHWWSPWAETVPRRANIVLDDIDLSGEPVLRYRDIYRTYAHDEGAFAARNRLNRQGDPQIAARYGGSYDYGPPYHVHTFNRYVPPGEYFEAHPEYFSLIDGERKGERSQLCLTNEAVRDLVVEKLRGYIAQAEAAAAERGLPPPRVYSISQNDWRGACQCERCQAIAEREGSEAGPLLDFVNYVADAIADEHPEIYISTLAYQYTQEPPATIRPRDNVIIRLCDTTSNFTRSIVDPENEQFHDFLLQWAEIAPNLRVWDYAVTYARPRGLPMPSVHTYGPDFRFYAEHNVEGVFTELEYPVRADMRDLKVWMMIKLLEDPYADHDALLETFTDGFYGAAGPMIREYLQALEAASQERISYISMGATLPSFSYLTLDFVRQAQGIFDRAEAAVADDEALLARVRHARMPLDRATVMLARQLTGQWVQAGNEPDTFPLDRDAIAQRYRATWTAEAQRRLPEDQRAASLDTLESELVRYTALPTYVPPPEKFADLPPERVHDFTADVTRNWKDIVQVVRDDEAESGITNRLQFPTQIATDDHPLERYTLPMPWGLYDQANREGAGSGRIETDHVPGPGYHWFRMGTFEIGPSYYLYFFWSWIIQVDIDSAYEPEDPDQQFEVWARIKFEGPAFPHGEEDEANAICVERVVLVETQ